MLYPAKMILLLVRFKIYNENTSTKKQNDSIHSFSWWRTRHRGADRSRLPRANFRHHQQQNNKRKMTIPTTMTRKKKGGQVFKSIDITFGGIQSQILYGQIWRYRHWLIMYNLFPFCRRQFGWRHVFYRNRNLLVRRIMLYPSSMDDDPYRMLRKIINNNSIIDQN